MINGLAGTAYTFTAAFGTCVSASSGSVTIAVQTVTPAPTGATPQDACASGTIADFVVNGTSIVWYASVSSTTSIPTSTPAVVGTTYYASQTVSGCTSTSRLAVVANGPCLGVKVFDESNFSFYPNPVTEMLNLKYSKDISEVKLINILGQELLAKTTFGTEVQVDMSNLPSGTYIVKIKSDDLEKTIKVVKK